MSSTKSNLLLLLAAAIWGFNFVAQRVGLEYIGPFTLNGVRFLVGSLSLIPIMLYFGRNTRSWRSDLHSALLPGLLAGLALFTASSLQQLGLVQTTAGKAAFITSLYIVLVPMIGIFLGQLVGRGTWLGCLIALLGLYFLCIKESSSVQPGDLLELMGAFFWAVHILIIGHFSRQVDVLKMSFFQFITCSVLSLLAAVIFETVTVKGILAAAIPILFGGLFSVGIAYTLQAVGQKYSPPAHSAIILSMETVFAAIGGFLILGELFSGFELLGCFLMLTGMLVSQLLGVRTPA